MHEIREFRAEYQWGIKQLTGNDKAARRGFDQNLNETIFFRTWNQVPLQKYRSRNFLDNE